MSERDDLTTLLREYTTLSAAQCTTLADAVMQHWLPDVLTKQGLLNEFHAKQFGILQRERDTAWGEAERQETRADALAATVERVRALCDRYYRGSEPTRMIHANDLRAALDDNGGSETGADG